mmetsp:Transcript_4704/g.10503  ORF Transcript_4704/g.10503 Transcript_4704/m.10503 type:complete len:435 (-) Transcript_4704:4-1308(-)
MTVCTMTRGEGRGRPLLSPVNSLCLLVMVDMFAVALVVPLLHQYYKASGVQSAGQREMLSSVFSLSQIAGGLVIGVLSDTGALTKRNVLLISFLGSAASYLLIFVGGLKKIIFSRVLVGSVKQTMTVSTSLLAQYSTPEARAESLGRISSASTVAWILGPTVGGFLYKHVHPSSPALVASILFLFNSSMAYALLPRDEARQLGHAAKMKKSKYSSFVSNLRLCVSSPELASVVGSLVLFGWVTRTTSYQSMSSFYEEKYSMEPHQRGYLKSYQQFLNFVAQNLFVGTLLSKLGGERHAACYACAFLAASTLVEVSADLRLFVGVICPSVAVASGLMSISLRSLVTQVAPKDSLSSVLAALDVLQNLASVTVPLYRTYLFYVMARYSGGDQEAEMAGDPTPSLWLMSSVLHWTIFAILIRSALLGTSKGDEKKNR